MNRHSKYRTSPLMDASLLGRIDLVSELLDSGAEINQRDDSSWTAMHYASAAGHTEIVELLLTRGADVNCTTNRNESCLLLAAWNGHDDVVRVLVSAGVNVNLKRDDGFSPLHATSHRGCSDMVKLMLDKIAQVDITISNDGTSLMQGQQDSDEFLLAYNGADINSVTSKNESCLLKCAFKVLKSLARAFVSAKCDSNSQSNDNIAQLHVREFIGMMKNFLRDVQVNTGDNFYDTIPLFCTVLSRHDDGNDGHDDDDDYDDHVTYWMARYASVNFGINFKARDPLKSLTKGDIGSVSARVTAGVTLTYKVMMPVLCFIIRDDLGTSTL